MALATLEKRKLIFLLPRAAAIYIEILALRAMFPLYMQGQEDALYRESVK
jgi:hypothetical protein